MSYSSGDHNLKANKKGSSKAKPRKSIRVGIQNVDEPKKKKNTTPSAKTNALK
jgi:hypothetical protein